MVAQEDPIVWNRALLAIELQGLVDLGFDLELTGFEMPEIDLLFEEARESSPNDSAEPEDKLDPLADPAAAVTRLGDLWLLGRHRLLCGDSRQPETISRLMGNETAGLIFTDPPYNVPIDGNVCGLGRVRHREFAMGPARCRRRRSRSSLSRPWGTQQGPAPTGPLRLFAWIGAT